MSYQYTPTGKAKIKTKTEKKAKQLTSPDAGEHAEKQTAHTSLVETDNGTAPWKSLAVS